MDYFASPVGQHPPSVQLKTGTLLPTPEPLRPFGLTGQDGKPFTIDHLRGHWTFLAMGCTSCPNICPTALATFRAVSQQIIPEAGKPPAPFLLVSVDPGRDTPERLAQYVRYFDPTFLGATGSEKALPELGLSSLCVEEKGSALG
jgi:protein SCO1/2